MLDAPGLAGGGGANAASQLGVVASSMHQPVGALSGGNQQKVVFAKWIEAAPSMLVLDDPTRGIDVGAKREMHRIMRHLARSGRVVLFYSSDPGEIVAVADRVVVFVDGVLTKELDGDTLHRTRIGHGDQHRREAGNQPRVGLTASRQAVTGENQHAQIEHHTMWIGNVRNLSFQDQLKATAAVGLDEMSMTPLDVDRNRAKGISPRDMRKMAADVGVGLPILDPMASWAPHWRSGISDPGLMEFLGYSADDFFRIADELGVSIMTVIGTLQPGLASVPEIAESFAVLADRAAEHGLRCILEFIPIWGIKDLGMAWQILQIADRPNTALAFDFWHLYPGPARRRLVALHSGRPHRLRTGHGRRS